MITQLPFCSGDRLEIAEGNTRHTSMVPMILILVIPSPSVTGRFLIGLNFVANRGTKRAAKVLSIKQKVEPVSTMVSTEALPMEARTKMEEEFIHVANKC